LAVSLLATATMPVFVFALYRNPGNLHFSRHLRWLALSAAIALTLLVALGLPPWIRSLAAYLSALQRLNPGVVTFSTLARDPRTIFHVSTLLTEISNLGLVLLLMSIFRQVEDQPDNGVAISRFFRTVTKTTLTVWGLWLGFNLIRGILTPYIYLQVRNYAAQAHQLPPPPIDLVAGMTSAILLTACLFTPPYVVYKSLPPLPKENEVLLPGQEESPEPN
jgi:hypothetical protein